jgi:hypothetical protein
VSDYLAYPIYRFAIGTAVPLDQRIFRSLFRIARRPRFRYVSVARSRLILPTNVAAGPMLEKEK